LGDPLAAFTLWSKRSQAGCPGCSIKSSAALRSRLLTPTGQRTLCRHRWRPNRGSSQGSMLTVSPTRRARPYLPAEASSFSGVFR
jgi:hypothetical protein